MSEFILQMEHITKEFPGVKALDDVTFSVKKGEIHALCGENGAGKSTLMKILSGVYSYGSYNGDIVINGEIQNFEHIKKAEEAGVTIIYQELALAKEMTIGENIFLGSEPKKGLRIDWDKLYFETSKCLKEVGLNNISPNTKIKDLGIGQQQLVEIAKALSKNAKILVLDEPTAALTESEVDILIDILNELRKSGVTCIYISHKLGEVMRLADRVTVLRDGKTIATKDISELNEDKIIAMMVGRELTDRFPKEKCNAGEIVLEVKDYTVYDINSGKKIIDNANFHVRKGEILGIAGLMGAGRTELATSMFGALNAKKEGEILIDGKKITINNPVDAINAGLGYVSEDRKRYGLVLGMDVKKNTTLSSLEKIQSGFMINKNEEISFGNKYVEELKIKTPNLETKVNTLSGGNQQKVVLGKWLMTEPKVLILDEPTRGIDVGAKFEIYNLMNKLVRQGVSIIMISSELPEVLGMSDRILVMHEGKINGELKREDATQEKIMYSATGGE